MATENELLYRIALTLIHGVGDTTAKKLVAYCHGAEAVFKEKKRTLDNIPGIGAATVASILNPELFARAEQELEFITKNQISPLYYLDAEYPKRLKECEDGPILLYTKGNTNFNNPMVLSIVGSRMATHYGKKITEQVVEQLAPLNCLIVSGLAHGIDIAAHKAAMQHKLQTVGVVAHGLDMIYPAANRKYAHKMLEEGGWATDFMSGTFPDKMFFPRRNRIIAGLADATLVVEAAEKSGTLITAELAFGYQRDVMAVPGNVDSELSGGCNKLIRENKAALVTGATDIMNLLSWHLDDPTKKRTVQPRLFVELTPEEEVIVKLLQTHGATPIDMVGLKAGLPASKCSSLLFTLEFKGVVRPLPGKVYELV